jgi:biopolymer transport protein ExbD
VSSAKRDPGEDTVLNMTPMIDICFQLVVFFMLTLEFKSIDRRFETQLPKDRGQQASAANIKPFKDIEVKLFRDNLELGVLEQRTKIRVGETFTVLLPKGPWPKDSLGEDARRMEEEKVMAQVTAAIAAAWAQQGKNPEISGEIKTPFPKGQAVPHGDVMKVLDSFLAAGIVQVNFEGAAAPMMRKDGGGWGFDK